MPITPYNAPIQYEYKPLNLSSFAVPLAKMQEDFDVATAKVGETDFDLANLPYGSDPEKAKKLKELVTSKRDELAKNLAETKNYKAATSKIKELQTLWSKDPEKLALESNYKLWQERDKAERERIDNGKDNAITREYYQQWRDREINKYEENKGAAFKADYGNEEGTYNTITGQTGRLADLSKDLEEMSWKVANAVPSQRYDAFRAAGFDVDTRDKKFVETIVNEKEASVVAQRVSDYLKTLPRFRDWANEVSDYNFDAVKSNPDRFNYVAKELNNKYIGSLDYQIKKLNKDAESDKSILNSKQYKDLLEEKQQAEQAKQTGVYDVTATKNLFQNEHLNNVYDMGALGNVFAYQNIEHNYTFRDMPDEGDDSGDGSNKAAGDGYFIPNTEEQWSISALGKDKIEAGKNLYKTAGSINSLLKGNIGAVVMGEKGTAEYNRLMKNPDLIRARQEQLFNVITQTASKNGTWKDFKNLASRQGIKMSDNRAVTIWSNMTKKDNQAISEYQQNLESSREDFDRYSNSTNLLSKIETKIKGTTEYAEVVDNIGNTLLSNAEFSKLVPTRGNPGNPDAVRAFNINSYTPKQLKDAGISGDKLKRNVLIAGDKSIGVLTFNEVAKLHGYKSVKDAVDKGFNFYNIKIGNASTTSGSAKGTTKVSLLPSGTIKDHLNSAIDQLYKSDLGKEEMSYRYINDKNIDKQLSRFFLASSDLTSYQPAYHKSWDSVPGFTEDGKLEPSTRLNITENRAPKIVVHGNNLLYEVPITYLKDGKVTEGTVTVKPKAGMNIRHEELLDNLDANSQSGTPADMQTNTMIKAAKFDVRFAGNNLSPQLIQSVEIPQGGRPVELYNVPLDNNSDLVVEKVFNNGATKPILKIKYMDRNSGKTLGYMKDPNTGKPFYAYADDNQSSTEIKSLMMQALGR